MSIYSDPLVSLQSYVQQGRRVRSRSRLENALFPVALVLGDVLMLASAFCLAYWVRFDLQVSLSPDVVPSQAFYTALALVLTPVWLSIFLLYGLYDKEQLLGGTGEYSKAFNACTAGIMFVVLATFVRPSFVVARGWLVAAWIFSVLLVCAGRFFVRRFVYAMRRAGHFVIPAVIIGSNGEARSLASQIVSDRSAGYEVLGVVTTRACDSQPQSEGAPPVLGSLEEVVSIVSGLGVQELIVAASSLGQEDLLDLLERVQNLPEVSVRLSTGLYEVLTTGVQVKTAASIPLISLNRLRLDPVQAVVKSAIEYTIAAASLICLAPIMAAIAALIKLDSPGPVMHRRRVLGTGGKEFDAFKLRTMYVNGDDFLEERPGLKKKLLSDAKLKDDPRITRVGTWLRRYSLDELPQLANVLLGQMGLVGPRMITPPEASRYGHQKLNLLSVKPGITGLWQVSGRSDLSYAERVRLDMYYIRNYSIWLDLQILFLQTPAAVIRGRGAY